MIRSTRTFLLAGASALAILASAAEANAETFAFTERRRASPPRSAANMRSSFSAPAEGIRLPLIQ